MFIIIVLEGNNILLYPRKQWARKVIDPSLLYRSMNPEMQCIETLTPLGFVLLRGIGQ